MEYRSAVTQAGYTSAVEQVGVDSGNLGRAVRPQTQHPARELVHQLKGLQVKRLTGPGQQGL
jgi:hypothetical protein